MAVEIYEISARQLERILTSVESHFLDFKRKEIRPSKMTDTISAFANADGGELFVGIAESGLPLVPHTWDGFPDPEDANSHILEFEKLFPLGGDHSYNFLTHPTTTGYVLQVVIKKSRSIVKANDGVPRVRKSAQNLPVDTPEKVVVLERNKGITSYERDCCNRPFSRY